MKELKPLYRKVRNNESYNKQHNGTDYKHTRNTKKQILDEDGSYCLKQNETMSKQRSSNGYDYTPLYKFLHSKEGKDWDSVYSEAKLRLDSDEAIWHIVETESDLIPHSISRTGESQYYHSMYIDNENKLRFIDKSETITPTCKCCTWTLNGKVINGNK